jgi:hypothetical protein
LALKRATVACFYMTTRSSLSDAVTVRPRSLPRLPTTYYSLARQPQGGSLATEFLVATLPQAGFQLTQSQQTRSHFSSSNKFAVSGNVPTLRRATCRLPASTGSSRRSEARCLARVLLATHHQPIITVFLIDRVPIRNQRNSFKIKDGGYF